jgi:hypothetical protein
MRWGLVGLWAVFALLVAFGGWEFLEACGLTFGPHIWNYCQAPLDRSLEINEDERGERLQRLIHAAELQLAQKPLCAAPPPPKPPDQPEFRPDEHPSLGRGGKEGKVEVFLRWNTLDDLDLQIYCPGGGQIGGQNGRPGSCGEAKVDVDANRNLTQNVTNTPEEHAVWATTTPNGEFKVQAFIFKAVNSNIRQTIPFEMTFKIGDDVKVCHGEVTLFPVSSGLKTSYGKPLSSHNPFLQWSPSEGLPASCDWKIEEGYYCSRGECEKN